MIDVLIRLIADGLVILIAVMGAAAFILRVRADAYQRYLVGFMAGLSALVTAKIFSLFYQAAERPFVTLGVSPKAAYLDNPGFPSDHALFVAVITLVVALTIRNRRLAIMLTVLSLAVGAGRVLALVHSPLDVIGGFAAAVLGVAPWYLTKGQKKCTQA